MNLDLTAAIEAARNVRLSDNDLFFDLSDQEHMFMGEASASVVVTAVAPLIAAQVAERIAAAIASRRQSAETADEFDGLDAAEAIAREAVR